MFPRDSGAGQAAGPLIVQGLSPRFWFSSKSVMIPDLDRHGVGLASLEPVRIALSEATKLARIAERVARGDRARSRVSVSEIKSRLEARQDAAADVRLRRSMLRYVPLSGPWRSSLDRKEREIKSSISSIKAEGREATARTAAAQEDIARAAKVLERLDRAERALVVLGLPPSSVAGAAKAVANRAVETRLSTALPRGGESRWASDALDICEAAVAVVRDWARDRARADANRPAPAPVPPGPAGARPAIASPGGERRIYLPIPSTLGRVAMDAGALVDRDAPKGASPWYVTPEMDLSKVSGMLPIAMRPQRSGLTFPPVPYRAAGQSLAALASETTWSHIRKTSYALSGRRCQICGGRGEGGFLAESVYPQGEGGVGVECHEVWDWKIPSESNGIGVQTLAKMLVVCRNCHVLFHSAFFLNRAREAGIEDKVAAAIEKRRMLITRMTRDELGASLAKSSEHLRKASGVDKWVLDLGHLSAQQFMQHHVPVIAEDNRASFPPERIAGLSFETDAGRSFEARTAAEVYADLLAEDAELTSVVVPFSRRG